MTKATKSAAGSKVKSQARPVIAVSLGCPAGIGPEVALGAFRQLTARAKASKSAAPRLLFVGDPNVVDEAARATGAAEPIYVCDAASEVNAVPAGGIAVWGASARVDGAFAAGQPNEACGRAQFAWVRQATELVLAGVCDALATGPVSKAAVASSGAKGAKTFRGHTEYLAELTGAKEVVMAFVSEELVTALVTTHLPLSKVAKSIRPELVCAATFWLARLLLALDSSRAPQLAIASLNPHAGESGLLGREELDAIAPGIELARKRLRRAKLSATLTGPIGAETAFRKASSRVAPRSFDGVVAMYHDQATIPSKVLSFGEAVNVTLGLPLVRTSVDHGTGYDVAWQGTADPSGMVGAIELAERLVRAGLVRTTRG